METVLQSSLPERFEFQVLDTAPPKKDEVSQASRFRLDSAWGSLGIILRLLRCMYVFRPQVVHINTSYFWGFVRDGAMAWLVSLWGARTVLHVHGGDFERFYEGCPAGVQALIRATLGRVDRVIVLDLSTEAFFARLLPDASIRSIPNFVDTSAFRSDHAGSVSGSSVHVLYIGWLIEAKGILELIAAARRIPDARFTLAGPAQPDFADQIRADVDALGDRFRVLGPCSREQVIDLLAGADVFVLASHREGFPVVILEAMAAGLPIVATSVGAIPEVIRSDWQGILVPSRDPEALTRAIEDLCRDPQKRERLGRRALEKVRSHFDRDVVLEELADLYTTLGA